METKKIILIIFTILILGPIVFVGSCFPLGLGVMDLESYLFEGAIEGLLFPITVLLCLGLAIFVCYKVIKKIIKS